MTDYNSDGEFAADLFGEDVIAEAMTKLPGYDRYDTIASVNVSEDTALPGKAVRAFADLADILHAEVVAVYGRLEARRQRPVAELRKRAIGRLQAEHEKNER